MVDVQRGFAAPPPRFVLDVVVDEKRVVVELERRGGRQYRLEMAAEPEAGRDAQCRPQRLPAAKRVVEDQVVEAVRPALTRTVQPVDLAVTGVLAHGEIVVEHGPQACRVTYRRQVV